MALAEAELRRRATAVSWLLLDVDGVLTDGRLYYGPQGEELKVFHVRDGLALKLAQRHGIKVGVLSARRSRALEQRSKELGFDEELLRRSDKREAFQELLTRHELRAEQVAYAGDDLLDLPVLAACGLAFAPADAVAEVRERAHVVLATPGGRGAVRELVELLLTVRGDWQRTVDSFLS